MKKFLTIIISIIVTLTFSSPLFAEDNSQRDELKQNLESLLNWAVNNLMPRSKKDASRRDIDRETRDIVKKIQANSDWLRNHMIAQINDGLSMNEIRDDFEQEQHYIDLYNLTNEALERTDNPQGEKLNEMLIRFYDRYVVPIGEIVGYSISRGERRGKHGNGHGRYNRDREYSDYGDRNNYDGNY